MIVPTLSQPRADMEEDLDFLFKLCGLQCSAASFNYDNSLVAFHKGQLVGFVTSWWDHQPGAFIDLILVHPDYRSRGIGYYLATAMQAVLVNKGVTRIYVALDNEKLIPAFEKHGFQHRKGYFLMEWNNG